MPEWLRNILNKIKEWWAHFTKRQKGIIIGLSVVVLVVFIIVIYAVSRPSYTKLITCDTTSQSSQVTTILTDAGIEYSLSTNALVVSVKEEDMSSAELALGAAGYKPDEYTLETALGSSSLTTSSSDTAKRYQLYMETRLQNRIVKMDGISECMVSFHIPDQDGTLIAQKQESSAYIQLTTDGTFTSSNAANLARAVATFLGNDTTSNITILDNDGTLLFAGGDDYSSAGIANSMQELQNQAESYMANMVKKLLIGTYLYNNVEVTSHLDMDYSNYEDTVKRYYANEGYDQGLYSHRETYESESESGVGGVPGTDSNGEGTTYVTNDYDTTTTSQSETSTDYLPNEESKYTVTPAGSIKYTQSSISIAAITFNELREEDAKTLGLLDGITWEEYKLANSSRIKQTVDSDYYNLVSTATGIPVENITILAYTEPIFYDKESLNVNWTTILSVGLILLIAGLLIFTILRTMSNKKAVEEEEEISVEDLLQSNPQESEVEDIDVETKSETRKMIEKFVDDNPEAAAALLRNWLNDGWG